MLEEAGIKTLAVEEVTNFPEILDGRVKTLNPYIHGGLLGRRDLSGACCNNGKISDQTDRSSMCQLISFQRNDHRS